MNENRRVRVTQSEGDTVKRSHVIIYSELILISIVSVVFRTALAEVVNHDGTGVTNTDSDSKRLLKLCVS